VAQEAEYLWVLKEVEDKFEKWIAERVQEEVNVLMASMGSGVVP
jgi:phage anti-repressor protein